MTTPGVVSTGAIMKKKHLGSKFEDFLEQEDILEGCRASAIKFKIAHQLERAMSQRKISNAEMAKQLRTSRTGIEWLLDPANKSVTLNTMAKVAHLLGKRIEFAMKLIEKSFERDYASPLISHEIWRNMLLNFLPRAGWIEATCAILPAR